MSEPKPRNLTKLTPRQEWLAFNNPQFAIDFAADLNNRRLLTAAFAEWVAAHTLDPSLHFKVAGVNEFLSVLLSFGEPDAPVRESDPTELENT